MGLVSKFRPPRLIRGRTRDLVYVDRSEIEGRGLFARTFIPEGKYIGTYEGIPTRRNGRYVLWVEDDDGNEMGRRGTSILRFLNHSFEPNAEFDGFDLFAIEDIEPGEEITFDYGEDPS